MAFWKKSRKRKSQPTVENISSSNPQKQRKGLPAEVKLLAAKALEAGLPPGEASEIVGAGNCSVTAWARSFREGGVESLVAKSTSTTTRRICEKLERRIQQERLESRRQLCIHGNLHLPGQRRRHHGLGRGHGGRGGCFGTSG